MERIAIKCGHAGLLSALIDDFCRRSFENLSDTLSVLPTPGWSAAHLRTCAHSRISLQATRAEFSYPPRHFSSPLRSREDISPSCNVEQTRVPSELTAAR